METISQGVGSLAFYSQHSHVLKYFVFFLILDLSCIAVFIGLLVLLILVFASGILTAQSSLDFSLLITIPIIISINLVLVSFLVILLSFSVFFTMRRLISHKPALLITYAGIDCRDLPAPGDIFLSWSEIASLYVVSIQQTSSLSHYYLCFVPKDRVQFLLRFHPLRRVFVRWNSIGTGTLIHIPYWYLPEPVGEILSQIQVTFQDQMRAHEIQVLGIESR